MKEMILRELTEEEREKLNSFIADENTELYQYFLGIVMTDLFPHGNVSWDKALGLLPSDHTLELPYSICGVIDAWIRLCMEYKSYGLVDLLDQKEVRGLRNNIQVAVNGFVNCIYYDVSIGGCGKKQSDLENSYTMLVMQGVPKYSDIEICADPEEMYRFIMTAIENLGFRLVVQSDNTRKINLDMFKEMKF